MAKLAIALLVGLGLVGFSLCALATPLHGLGAVFQAQKPEVYQETVSKAVVEMNMTRGRSIEDLRKRAANSQSGADAESIQSVGRSAERRPTARQQLRAEAVAIRRDLGDRKTQDFVAAQIASTQAKMQARELIEVLAYFNAENVNWDGHMGPGCDYPGFRRVALQSLPKFGEVGAEAVVQAIGEELTGVTIPREVSQAPAGYVGVYNSVYSGQTQNPLTRGRQQVAAAGLSPEQIVQRTLLMNSTYHGDLVDLLKLLKAKGLITPRMAGHLKTCAAGKKPAEVRPLANGVAAALFDLRSKETADLFGLLRDATEADERKAILAELAGRSPAYAEIRDQMGEIMQLAAASAPEAAQVGRDQWINALQRAPIGHCLFWIGKASPELAATAWAQVDDRIARANDQRRAAYQQTAMTVLGSDEYPAPSKSAALDLLTRLKQPDAIGPLVDLLPKLPREIWGNAGKTLQHLSGKDFGPRAGDGLAEVIQSQKQWQQWLREKQ